MRLLTHDDGDGENNCSTRGIIELDSGDGRQLQATSRVLVLGL